MKPLVFDSTPLIYLAKVNVIGFVENMPGKKFISTSVYREVVVQGKKIGESDAFLIDNLIDKGVFQVKDIKEKTLLKKLQKSPLHLADIETLTLAKELDGVAIIDEKLGKTIADIKEVENRGTIFILFRLLESGLLDGKDLREKLDEMIGEGWRCSTELYAIVLEELERLSAL
ncbi:MAG: DUF3368 domain-containing protein [Candidatus Altiarchaeota archaeon]|nr:DUF3368 domain-containing protein [Candidatus Altiarchaeota archaeon]